MGLFFVTYCFSLWFTQSAWSYAWERVEIGESIPDDLVKYYGSLWQTIYSLYMAVSGGLNWGYILDPLHNVGAFSVFMFLLFISISIFGVLNIVTSVFVESAMQCTQYYKDLLMQEKARRAEVYTSHMLTIFRQMDTDRSGTISMAEMEGFLSEGTVCNYFEALE